MGDICTSSTAAWKKASVSQPDLQGELYVPMFCQIDGLCPPALVILPDDSGISDARERAYAEYFVSRGLTCLLVDPFSPMGIAGCIDNPRILPLREMMAQACAAYGMLIVRRRINSVGVLGIGRGGLAAIHLGMDAVPNVPRFTGRFDFHVALSPAAYIQLRTPKPTGAPMLIVSGGRDELCIPSLASEYAARIQHASAEASVTTLVLPDAPHAWDRSDVSSIVPNAVRLPGTVFYLEDDATYTDSRTQSNWLPGAIVDFMAAEVRYGAKIGGGGSMFNAVCQSIDAFIMRHRRHAETESIDTGLHFLNRMDKRDDLLLRMGRCESLEELFALVSGTFAQMPETVLVRIWLLEPPAGACTSCPRKNNCRDRSQCLHLVASAGHSVATNETWPNTQGRFERIPLGHLKVGAIAASGAPFHVRDVKPGMSWVADPEWIAREQVRTLLGQPLIHNKKVIGVIIVFSRGNYGSNVMDGLRIIADHLSIRIAHARAFDELTRLKRQLEIENTYLQRSVDSGHCLKGIIGQSPAIQRVKEQILDVASTGAIVLITGESGTGKEMVANEIHAHSQAKDGPLIKVNCPTIPHELFESEFFGHVKGAFTGANADHIGFFEAAEGGSLFLDEVGEIVITQQSKLLRALQESEYRRVGEQRSRHFHTRIIAATNRSLRDMVDAGSFREDLYYRLNVFPIRMPPLRERMEDLPLLVESFLRSFAKTLHRPGLAMAEGHMEKLMNYSWPGNIRELQNVIHRACILARDGIVRVDALDAMLAGARGSPVPAGAETAVQISPQAPQVPQAPQTANRIYTMEDLKRLEKESILNAVRRCNGKIFGANGAAALLGLKPTTLIARLEKMGIERRKLDTGR